MTTVKGITMMIHNFYRKLGVTNIKVKYTTDQFCFIPSFCGLTTPTICYNLQPVEKDIIKGYTKFFKKRYGKVPSCSMFTFSLLHELGHAITENDLNETYEMRSFEAKKRLSTKLEKKEISLVNAQARYCELYVEKIANDVAIELIEKNYDLVMKYDKNFAETF